jgi:hypothetical protein
VATYVRFVNEGEVEANEEITEMVKLGLVIPTGRWPGEYEVLDAGAISWELGRTGSYDVIHAV